MAKSLQFWNLAVFKSPEVAGELRRISLEACNGLLLGLWEAKMFGTEWGGGTPRENAIDDTIQAWALQFVPQVGYPKPSSCLQEI